MDGGVAAAAMPKDKETTTRDADAWRRAKAVLAEVLELPPAERPAYLDKHCPDPDLRREVDALLKQSDEDFLRSVATVPDFVTPFDAVIELPPGARIDRYVVLDRLGEGGMGKVYLATDTELHRRVAVKCLTAHEPEKELRRKLLDEARAASRLNHPNIATVYDVVEHDGRTFLVMEYVEGDSLADELRRERMSLPRTLAIGRELASALSAAHAKGIVHRDLKPANIQVMRNGSVKVLDFGVAQAISMLATETASRWDDTSDAKTRGVPQPGTPAYMSPEQLHGGRIDHRSDVYSLGVILYEMTAGRRPFATTDPLELIAAFSRRLLRPDEENPDVPADVSDAIAKALAVDPNERYLTASDFEKALAELCARYPLVPQTGVAAGRRPLRSRLLRAAGIVATAVAVIWFIGYLETALFNETLGRAYPFDRESPMEWLKVGRQSIVPLLFYATLILLVLWAAKFALSAMRLSRRFDQLLTTGEKRTRALSSRLGFDDPLRFAQACAAFGLVALGIVFWRYHGVVDAFMTRSISTMPLERVLPLQTGHRDDTASYRVVLTALMLTFGFMVYRVAQVRARHPSRRGSGALMLAMLPLIGAVFLGVLPHRIMFFNDFERIDYGGERCYLLGESPTEVLLHCPEWSPPRNRRISRGDRNLRRSGVKESIFTGPTTAH
jgi:predicted Ser/Thr protein kinase